MMNSLITTKYANYENFILIELSGDHSKNPEQVQEQLDRRRSEECQVICGDPSSAVLIIDKINMIGFSF